MLIDDHGISCFADNNGVTCWVDDFGETLCCDDVDVDDDPSVNERTIFTMAEDRTIVLGVEDRTIEPSDELLEAA